MLIHMKAFVQKLKRVLARVKGYFPTRLPQGMAEFKAWAEDFRTAYPLPTDDVPSIEFALASEVVRLGPNEIRKAKYYFYRRLLSGTAKQIAGATMQEIKTAQIKKQAEAIAATQQGTAADGPK